MKRGIFKQARSMTRSGPLGALLLLLLAPACSEEPAGSDGGPAPDSGPPDSGAPPLAPRTDPTEVKLSWMLAWVPTSSDPVLSALEQGTFTDVPQTGWDANKMHWSAGTTDTKGAFVGITFPTGVSWAVAKVKSATPARLYIRSGPTLGVWTNSVQRPGDVYASRKIWVPLPVKESGDNLVAVRIYGGRSEVQIQLYTTPDELVLNTSDVTVPDLLLGDTTEQCIGVAVLNLTDRPAYDLTARVVGSAELEETTASYPALGPQAVTQVRFDLRPKQAATAAGKEVTVKLRLESRSLSYSYEREVKLKTVGPDTAYRRTRRSEVDLSCQYYGVLPPSKLDAKKSYALALSLHGAGVEAINQAKSYSQRDWIYIVSPTNRRPFGFDWEVWGRLDALEALAHAQKTYSIDPKRIYVTGHSMGGHGTWHMGVMHPGHFAVVAPSAGWSSFYTYVPSTYPKPTGYFARTQAHSDTNTYLSNLKRRGVYILHGDADTSVPVSEGRNMYAAVKLITSDVVYHEEAGAGHWWDGSTAKGVDCVDWPAIFDFMKARTLDPLELTFDFLSPAPWVSPSHSFVTLRSQKDPYKDSSVSSQKSGTTVTLTTTNVRGMTLDGAALKKLGVTAAVVDGKSYVVQDGPVAVGEQDGKKPGVHGPFNEVMYEPFCLVYPDAGSSSPFAQYAAFIVSSWSISGNGHACAIPLSRLKTSTPAGYNLIFVGLRPAEIEQATIPLSWDASAIKVGSKSYSKAAWALTFVQQERLAAAISASTGSEYLLFRIKPFTSSLVLPDYLVWSLSGVQSGGFFTAKWAYDATLQR